MKIIIIILLLLPTVCVSQSKFKFEFSLIFGGCFANDSMEVALNGTKIINQKNITSDVVGSANFSLVQTRKELVIDFKNKKSKRKKTLTIPTLNLEIVFKEKSYKYNFDLRKGKILFAENCIQQGDKSHKQIFTVTQQDYPVIFL